MKKSYYFRKKREYLRQYYLTFDNLRCALRLNVFCMRPGVIVSIDFLKFGCLGVFTVVSSRFLIFFATPDMNLNIPSLFLLSVKKNGFLRSPTSFPVPVRLYLYNAANFCFVDFHGWPLLRRSVGKPNVFPPAISV